MAPTSAQQPFWLGGASASLAACFTHPLDRTKYALQVSTASTTTGQVPTTLFRALHTFATRDGIRSLWSGLSASILRQTIYSTSRFALYDVFSSRVQRASGTGKLSGAQTILCAGAAGGIAGMLGNPTEIVLVRMCADGVKAPAERYVYGNAVRGLVRIGNEEGMRAFYRGLMPNVVRSIIMNVSQLAVYTAAKQRLLASKILNLHDGVPVHIAASLLAGTAATTACAPADVLKSRLQSAKGTGQTIVGVLREGLRCEGPRFLMKGWVPAWLRLGPNTVLMFLFYEQLQRLLARQVI